MKRMLMALILLVAIPLYGATAKLAWDGCTCVSYNVYRSSSQAGPWTKIATTSASTFNDTAAPNGAAGAWYQVKGVLSDGTETGASNNAFFVESPSNLRVVP